MTEQKPQRKGRDFAIGFFGGPLLATIAYILVGMASSFLKKGVSDNVEVIIIYLASTGLVVVVPIITFVRHRKFIGIGILTALVAVPLLLLGSCFALSSFSH